jgi:hypothetical protein
MQKTFVYISSLLLCFLVLPVEAQKTKKKVEVDTTPIFNGLTIQADAASLLSYVLSNGETYSYEAGAQVDLKHKYFPVFELGYGGANKISNNNIDFKTNALFGRSGIDLNLLSQKKDEKPTTNLFLAGLRLGMSSFPYSISNAIITDNYWGGSNSINFQNEISTKIWYEITAGVKVEVTKNFFMGWTVRIKNLISQDVAGQVAPWYIPGYGINNGSSYGINYTLGYKLQIPTNVKVPSKKETEKKK